MKAIQSLEGVQAGGRGGTMRGGSGRYYIHVINSNYKILKIVLHTHYKTLNKTFNIEVKVLGG